jgi:digeranylgeranylglycerophospholipid reductase
MEFDIVVVGAGPAGSATARELSRKGARVSLLEEHDRVGIPVHCAGLVTPRTMKLAEAPAGLVLNQIKGAHIHSPTGRRLTLGGDRVRALVIDRAGLDRALARQAQECGAALVLGTRVVGVERMDGRVRLHMQRDGHSCQMDTPLVVGADGARSVVAGRNGTLRPPNAAALMGAEVQVSGLDEEFVHVYLGRDVAPGWFAWLIPVDRTHVRVGVGTTQPGQKLRRLLSTLLSTREELRGARVLRVQGGLIPLKPSRRLYSDNVLLVGDAAGQVKPTSGGGLHLLMVGARLCARAALTALTKDDPSHRALRGYQSAWDSTMGFEMARERALRRLLLSLTPRELDAIMDTLHQAEFRRLISRYGDIDLQSELFARLLGSALVKGSLYRLPASLWPKLTRLALEWGLSRLRRGQSIL